ncbi:MAG: glycosyltransferase family 39 protein [Polyangiales bacterium]
MSPRPAARREIGAKDQAIGASLALAYVALLLVTAPAIGLSRDEGIYAIAADQYGAWFRLLATEPSVAMTKEAIDAHWAFNHEHPALMKSLFALSANAQAAWSIFPRPSLAYRFPAMVIAGLLLWLVYIFGARTFGRQPGVFAAVAFALLPRVFYHAHLDCFDVPIVFFTTLTTYCYWRSLSRRSWAVPTGLAFGLALATKHNAWLLPIVFAIHFAWMAIAERAERRATGRERIELVPYGLLAMAVLGPVVFVGSWPWLWHDTVPRLREYAAFHLHHEYYNMAYFGVNYFRPPFPISYPFVMTLFTVPTTVLALGLLALASRAYAIVPYPLTRLFPVSLQVRRDSRATDVLLVGCMLAPIVVIALPSTPIFGGTKHWFPSYPFLCLYAGYGAQRTVRTLRDALRTALPDARLVVRLGAAGVLLLPSLAETMRSHPFGLSHYVYAAGGVPGSADKGMNRQFWGFTTRSLAPFFRRHLPDGGRIWICDTLPHSFEMLKRDGHLPVNVTIASTMAEADYVIVHHEHHFAEVEGQAWVVFDSVRPAYVLTHEGVPIITVYENPTRRARHVPR